MLCNECDKRPICIELCEEAEKYVSQDRGKYYGPGEVRFTPEEKEVLRLLVKGKTRSQIRYELEISPKILRNRIYEIQRKGR